MPLSLVENLFLLFSTGAQLYKYGECSTLWINWEGTVWLSLVENLFLLFSTGVQLYKEDDMGSVLLYGLTGKVLCGLA